MKNILVYFSLVFSMLAVFGLVKTTYAEQTPKLAQAQETPSEKTIRELKEKARQELNQLPSTSAQNVIGKGIQAMMMFMGAIMFLLVVYGGVLWMTAQGNTEKVGQAKNILVWAALGVAVMLTSYIIVNFVFTRVASSS